jgi:undecaprenyl-diphosphatase
MSQLIIFGAKYLIFFLLLLAAFFFFKQKTNIRKQLIVLGLISLPLIYLIAKLSSLFYFNPRPFVSGNFIPLISHLPDNGFPSDHVLLSSALAMLIFYYNRSQGLILLFLACLVGLARVLAGVHNPIDIIASIVISFLVSLIVYHLSKTYLNNKFPLKKLN